MSDAGWSAIAAVGASALTAVASLGAVTLSARLQARAQDRARQQRAFAALLAGSLSVLLRATSLQHTMQVRSGLSEGLDVTLRLRQPLDPMQLHDWLAADWTLLNDSWGEVWLAADQEGVHVANRLVQAVAEALSAFTQRGQARCAVGRTVLGEKWTGEQSAAREQATRELAASREAAAQYARRRFGRPVVRLFHTDPPGRTSEDRGHMRA